MTAIQPGVGWGAAVIGASADELVASLGPPTERFTRQDWSYLEWHSLGLQVSISATTHKAVQVSLFANDPDEPELGVAEGATERGARFGMTEDEVVALHGAPRRARHVTEDNQTTGWLVYDGIDFRFINDELVCIGVAKSHVGLPPSVGNPELEAAIAANPDDPAAYLVYADWLQQHGDLRGELITMQAARLRAPDDEALAAAERAWLVEHRTDLLGPLADHEDMLPVLEWRLGVLRRVKIANSFHRSPEHDGEDEPFPVEELLAMLLDSDCGRFVQDLAVGIVTYEDNTYGGVMATLAARPRPSIRTLFLGDFDSEETELNWSSLGDAAGIYQALPNLRSLTLRSGSMTLGAIELPELREFITRTGGLTQPALAAIANARWPRLEKLSIQIGSRRYGSNVAIDDLQPILDGGGCPPGLRHLGLTNTEHTSELVSRLAGSRILPRIRELDLSLGTLDNAGAELLVKHRAAFGHLERLDLSNSWLHGDVLRAVSDICANVDVSDQRWDPQYPDQRYIAAGE